MENRLKLTIGEEIYESELKFNVGDKVWHKDGDEFKYVEIRRINVSKYRHLGDNWPDDRGDFEYKITVNYEIYSGEDAILVADYDLYGTEEVKDYVLDRAEKIVGSIERRRSSRIEVDRVRSEVLMESYK